MPGMVAACLSASRAVFQVRGADATKFLHGILTVDMKKCAAKGAYGAMLNAQGRILADVFVYPNVNGESDASFLVDCDISLKETLIKHLNMYKLRSDVTIGLPSGEYNVWSVWNTDSSNSDTGVDNSVPNATLLDERSPDTALRLLLPQNEKPTSLTSPLHEVSSSQYHVRRILGGIPEGVNDLPFSKPFPFESNFDYMRGVHFDKGCYLGQEPTARTFFRGATRKRIMPVQFSSEPLPPLSQPLTIQINESVMLPIYKDTPLTHPVSHNVVGSTCTVLHNVGLALIRIPQEEGKDLQVLSADGMDFVVTPSEKQTTTLYGRVVLPRWWKSRGTGKK